MCQEKNKDNDSEAKQQKIQVAIVGAGIAGLSLGVFLRKKGFEVNLYEAKSKDEVEKQMLFGNGIHLYFQCVRMLHAAGVPILKYLTPLNIQMRRDDGELRCDITREVQLKVAPKLEATRASVYSVLRRQLYQVLIEETPKSNMHCNKRCLGSEQISDDTVEVKFDDGTTVIADLVVGSDGLHSKVTNSLLEERELKKYGIVIIQSLSTFVVDDPIETWIIHRNGGTSGIVPTVLPSGELGTFNWITVTQSSLGDPEDDLEYFKKEIDRYPWDLIHKVFEKCDPKSFERWYAQDKDPLRKTWFKGRIVLIGDSCHAAVPFTGYGAGMCVEDAYWLAHALDNPSVLRDNNALKSALKAYEDRRAHYTADIVGEGRKLMNIFHPTNPIMTALINIFWNSGIPGSIVARKFIEVFDKGLVETEWAPHEKELGRLEV